MCSAIFLTSSSVQPVGTVMIQTPLPVRATSESAAIVILALTGKGVWIITVEKGCTDDDVKKMAEHMPPNTVPTYSGSPDEGGLCTFMMKGTKSDVETELETHTWPSPPVVSADFPISAIPDLDKTEDD